MKTAGGLKGPPSIWLAFAQQGRWKNWVMAGQLLCVLFLTAACLNLATRPPAVVVVGEDGHGTYVEDSNITTALRSFLRDQRGKASDITIRAFTERFVRLTSAVNSTTYDDAWAEALTMMINPLATRMQREAVEQKVAETYHLAQIRTAVDFLALDVVERRPEKTHVRAKVRRRKEKLMGGAPSEDVIQVDLVLTDVPRSRVHPDGLEVLDWRTAPVEPAAPEAPTEVTP